MNSKATKSFFVFVICLAAVAFAQGQSNKKKPSVAEKLSISEVKEYRKMFRVNETPIDMVEETSKLCSRQIGIDDPHYNPGVVYYINDVAREGLKTYTNKNIFPVGSIIVKEKQERRTEDSVQIITVMKKVSPSRAKSSWEYKMYDTQKWEEVKFEKQKKMKVVVNNRPSTLTFTQSCIGCHQAYKDNDYISGVGFGLLTQYAKSISNSTPRRSQ